MTCIVGIECVDGAIVAGDYMGSSWCAQGISTQSKVFSYDKLIMGYTTSFRFGQVIEHMLDDNKNFVPTDPNDTYRWLVRAFIPKLQAVLELEKCKGGDAVISLNGQVWYIQEEFSVLRYTNGVHSVGVGEDYMTSSILTQINMLGNKPSIEQAKKMLELSFPLVGDCVPGVSSTYSMITSNDV